MTSCTVLSSVIPAIFPFHFVGSTADGSGFTMGPGPALLNNVQCTGNELSLRECISDPIGDPRTCSGQAALVCQESKLK